MKISLTVEISIPEHMFLHVFLIFIWEAGEIWFHLFYGPNGLLVHRDPENIFLSHLFSLYVSIVCVCAYKFPCLVFPGSVFFCFVLTWPFYSGGTKTAFTYYIHLPQSYEFKI